MKHETLIVTEHCELPSLSIRELFIFRRFLILNQPNVINYIINSILEFNTQTQLFDDPDIETIAQLFQGERKSVTFCSSQIVNVVDVVSIKVLINNTSETEMLVVFVENEGNLSFFFDIETSKNTYITTLLSDQEKEIQDKCNAYCFHTCKLSKHIGEAVVHNSIYQRFDSRCEEFANFMNSKSICNTYHSSSKHICDKCLNFFSKNNTCNHDNISNCQKCIKISQTNCKHIIQIEQTCNTGNCKNCCKDHQSCNSKCKECSLLHEQDYNEIMWKPFKFKKNMIFHKFEHNYACTVHRSQGQSIPIVVICEFNFISKIIYHPEITELGKCIKYSSSLYVSITRAKSKIIRWVNHFNPKKV
jgi:hypothetical protein